MSHTARHSRRQKKEKRGPEGRQKEETAKRKEGKLKRGDIEGDSKKERVAAEDSLRNPKVKMKRE